MLIIQDNATRRIKYGLFNFEIDSSWIEAIEYKNKDNLHYKSYQEFKEKPVQIVPISQINYKIRKDGTPIFKDGENDEGMALTAKERVMNILAGFENGEKIKPAILYRQDNVDECVNLSPASLFYYLWVQDDSICDISKERFVPIKIKYHTKKTTSIRRLTERPTRKDVDDAIPNKKQKCRALRLHLGLRKMAEDIFHRDCVLDADDGFSTGQG
jgi:hypothetical protein